MSNLINSIDQVILENDLPFEWSDKINKELKDISPNKTLKRIDLRKKSFVTIDGKDAKDFDDAVYCEREAGGFILQVAIADVADIVDCGSEIDKEAIKRGTSIYFPKKVIPMLPEKISNDLCSLVPKKDRNVLVCKIHLDINGDIESYDFQEATINSHKRFTYNEVEYLKNNVSDIESNILDSISALEELTLKRLKNRVERSALEIDSAEPTLKFDNQDNLSKIHIPKRLFAHQMIEEAMILANICAAKYIKKHIGYGIYRVHEEPEVLKIENLKKIFIHQANKKMDEAIIKRFFRLYKTSAPKDILPMNIEEFGNSSVATIPTLFDLVKKTNYQGHKVSKGDIIMFASVGAGMNINAITYKV